MHFLNFSRVVLFAAASAALVAGCKKNATVQHSSNERVAEHRETITGTVEVDGMPLSFGYVVFLDDPDSNALGGNNVHGVFVTQYGWGMIGENGTYQAWQVPDGDVDVLVMTDPDFFGDVIARFQEQEKLAELANKGSMPSSARHQLTDRGPKLPAGRDGSRPTGRENRGEFPHGASEPPMGSDRLPPGGGTAPGGNRTSSAIQALPGRSMPPLQDPETSRLIALLAKGKETLAAFSDEQKDILAKIQDKYGRPGKGIRETIAEGQKKLDIKLTVEKDSEK